MRPLGLKRRRVLARVLAAESSVALEHRALLSYPDGRTVAEVLERYPRKLFTGS